MLVDGLLFLFAIAERSTLLIFFSSSESEARLSVSYSSAKYHPACDLSASFISSLRFFSFTIASSNFFSAASALFFDNRSLMSSKLYMIL